MAFKDITAGDKIGKVLGGRFIEANDKMGLEVSFSFEEPTTGGQETLSRVFWLSAAAMKKSMDDLTDVLDYNGSEVIDTQGVITDKTAFTDGQVKLVIEMEEHDGKEYPKILWVNKLGGSSFSAPSVETVKVKLQSLGFKAAFMAANANKGNARPRNADGKKLLEEEQTNMAESQTFDADDIPF